jgi:hypothetical protein
VCIYTTTTVYTGCMKNKNYDCAIFSLSHHLSILRRFLSFIKSQQDPTRHIIAETHVFCKHKIFTPSLCGVSKMAENRHYSFTDKDLQ